MSELPSQKVGETPGSSTKARILAQMQVFQEKIEQLERTDANLKKLASLQKSSNSYYSRVSSMSDSRSHDSSLKCRDSSREKKHRGRKHLDRHRMRSCSNESRDSRSVRSAECDRQKRGGRRQERYPRGSIANEPYIDPEPVKKAEDTVDPEILNLLSEIPEKRGYGPPLRSFLARQWSNILQKGLPKETKTELLKKYPTPSNCSLLSAPILNAEARQSWEPRRYERTVFKKLLRKRLRRC